LVANSTGIETGHFKDDVNLSFLDVATPKPASGAWFTPDSKKIAPDGLTYDTYMGSSLYSSYGVADLSGSVYVALPNTVLYVTSSISITAAAAAAVNTLLPRLKFTSLQAQPDNLHGGATATIGGSGSSTTPRCKELPVLRVTHQHPT